MTDRYHVGQVVRIIPPASSYVVGEICTVIAQRKLILTQAGHRFAYALDLKVPAPCNSWAGVIGICATEDEIVPVYDGWEKTEWSKCAWKPDEITVLIHKTLEYLR